MVCARRLLRIFAFFAFCSPLAFRAHAATLNYSGTFSHDDSTFVVSLSPSTAQNYTFTTTSFATGGFVPALTLFNASGGNPLAFAGTGTSDVSISQLLGPGSYVLYLTQDPNIFGSDLASGTLFAGSPTFTGDLCTGGMFLDTFNAPCTQRTGSYALTVTSNVAATPEPATWLLVLTPVAFLLAQRRKLLA